MVDNKIEKNQTDSSITYSLREKRSSILSQQLNKNIKLVNDDKIPSPEDEFRRVQEEMLSKSEQPKQTYAELVAKNLEQAVTKILEYADKFPQDSIIQKYAQKLRELVANNNLILTDIPDENVAGRAIKNSDMSDTILIDNHDSFSNFNPDNVVKTLLHELRHTMETDNLNSKAAEVEAELSANELTAKITGTSPKEINIEQWINEGYRLYPEASPGTYNIPQNTGFTIDYKPEEVVMDEKENKLLIKSAPHDNMDGVVIEDYVEFGDKKDENGNPFPVSAKRVIKDKSGQIISTLDYGEYDYTKREFTNRAEVYFKQKTLGNKPKDITMGLS